jgi:hypothetical protein
LSRQGAAASHENERENARIVLPFAAFTIARIPPTARAHSTYPRPLWSDANLDGRSFKATMGDS